MIGHALAVASLLLQSPRGVAEPPAAPPPVAIVSAIEGGAWKKPRTGSRKPLTLYDWLESEVVVELAPQARVDLIMIDGRRYALGGGSRAGLSPTSLTTLQGPIKEERAVPRLTFLAPIAGTAPREAGAVRLRARSVAKLNPCSSVRTLPDETILRFEPVEGASQYEVQVRTSADQQVFSRTIDKPPVAIPPGVLAGGTDYVWTVRALGNSPAASEGGFRTLDSAIEADRRALVTGLEPEAIGVLGGIDFHLGLLNESVAELSAAVERAPGNIGATGAARRARVALANACQ